MLRPHFAAIEAKRLGRRFGKRKADLKAAAELIDASTVMSGGGDRQAGSDRSAGGAGGGAAKDLAKTLKSQGQEAAAVATRGEEGAGRL